MGYFLRACDYIDTLDPIIFAYSILIGLAAACLIHAIVEKIKIRERKRKGLTWKPNRLS